MMIVGKSCSKYSATKDQQLLVKECGLKLLIPAQVMIPVDALNKITANGLWGGIFEFPENSQLISGVCHITKLLLMDCGMEYLNFLKIANLSVECVLYQYLVHLSSINQLQFN